MKTTRRKLLKTAVAAVPAIALGVSGNEALASPNGTFPTTLSNVSVVSVSAAEMRVSGKYSTLTGAGIAAVRVRLYAVSQSTFSGGATGFTDGSGNFSITTLKPPVGFKVQVEVEGNGIYSRPYPTYNRP